MDEDNAGIEPGTPVEPTWCFDRISAVATPEPLTKPLTAPLTEPE